MVCASPFMRYRLTERPCAGRAAAHAKKLHSVHTNDDAAPGGDMQVIGIGDFEVHRIGEFEGPFIAPETFFPDFDPEVLRSRPEMADPRLIDPATGKLVFSFHCFVVKTGRHTILI